MLFICFYYFTEQKAFAAHKKFHKDNNLSQLGPIMPMMANGAIFSTMFFALRGMANCPVESMKTGGILWFTDLTLQDPYSLLPLLTSLSLVINLKVGGEGISVDAQSQLVRKFTYGMILVTLPAMIMFPSVSYIHNQSLKSTYDQSITLLLRL